MSTRARHAPWFRPRPTCPGDFIDGAAEGCGHPLAPRDLVCATHRDRFKEAQAEGRRRLGEMLHEEIERERRRFRGMLSREWWPALRK